LGLASVKKKGDKYMLNKKLMGGLLDIAGGFFLLLLLFTGVSPWIELSVFISSGLIGTGTVFLLNAMIKDRSEKNKENY